MIWLQYLVVSLYAANGMVIEYNHSDERRPSGYDYIKNIKAAIEYDLRDKRVVKCYQCVYSPPRFETKVVARRRRDGGRELVNVTSEVQGGWAPCKGPFTKSKARQSGIDAGHCLSNCYTRLDHLGNLLRGCYRGEYGVNPNNTGCHQQAGYIYCFCEGDRCNSHLPTSPPKNAKHKTPDVRRVQKTYDEPYERGRGYIRPDYSEMDRQNAYNLRYSDRERAPDSRKRTIKSDRYRNTKSAKPKTREYRDKNSYTFLNSQYEKEVKEDDLPATRYRSEAEFGREAPSSVKKKTYRSSKDKDLKEYDSYTGKLYPYGKKDFRKDYDLHDKQRRDDDEKEVDITSSQRSLGSRKRSQKSPSSRNSPSTYSDRSRYKPVYHSYASDFADEYRKTDEPKQKEGIDKDLFSSQTDRLGRKHINKGPSGSVRSLASSWNNERQETHDRQVVSTTPAPLVAKKVDSNSGSRSWDYADEFMTQPEVEADKKTSKWPRYQYKSKADDTKKEGNRDVTWYIKEPKNVDREIISNSLGEKRREKQGLYDHRWFF